MSTSNPIGHKIEKDALLAVLWAGTAVSFGFLVFRLYFRIKVFRRLFTDDAFLIAAWFMTLANAAIWQVIWKELYLAVAVASGQAVVIPLDFLSQISTSLRGTFAAYLISYTGLWSVKLSFLFFFKSLGNRIRVQRIIWWTVLAFIVISYGICLGTIDYKCLLSKTADTFPICTSPHTVYYEYLTLRLATSLDVLTDAALILLSTNILWRVKIGLRKKLALIGICSLTSFIIAVTIVRVVIATHNTVIDLTWLILWGESRIQWVSLSLLNIPVGSTIRGNADSISCTAIIVACLASFRALYTRSERSRTPVKSDYHKKIGTVTGGYSYNNGSVPLQNKGLTETSISADSGHRDLEATDYHIPAPGTVHVRREFQTY